MKRTRVTRAVARLGLLAVGLGIGGAVAWTPAIASADTSTDWLSSLDSLLTGGAAPAADTSDLAISFDGITLLQEGTAHANSGTGDFAIADGAGTTATAYGTGDYAYAEGTDSTAVSGGLTAASGAGGTYDTAFVYGDDSTAFSGGTAANPGTFDISTIIGNGDVGNAGGDAAGAGSYDFAYGEGNDLGTVNAQGMDYLIDILKTYEDGTTSTAAAAADSTSSLADGSNLWTDLLSSLDPAGVAADSSNVWTELASLF
jgi:hypothetical protein